MYSLRLLLTFFAVSYVAAQDITKMTLVRQDLVHEFINTQYAGLVSVGGIDYLLVFDSTSCNLLLLSQECIGGSCNCPNLLRYPNSASTTYLDNDAEEEVKYFDTGSAIGRATKDDVKIVTLESQNQGIVLANEITLELCMVNADGIVGMSTPMCQNPFNLPTVFGNLIEQNQTNGMFSVHHARFPNGSHFGEVIFGGADPKYIAGDFTCAPLMGADSWKFKIDSFKIGDDEIDSDAVGLIDTSKYIVLGPNDKIASINAKIGCTSKKLTATSQEICVVDCDKAKSLPPVVFTIAGRDFNISSEYYIQQNGNMCYSGFASCDCDTYLIGDYYIDHYYSVFDWDNRRMCFAESIESL